MAVVPILYSLVTTYINSMILFAYHLRNKRRRRVPDLLIANFAVSAILSSAITMPLISHLTDITDGASTQHYDRVCKSKCFFQLLFSLTNVSLITALALDRCVAASKPILYKMRVSLRHGFQLCAAIWITNIVIAIICTSGGVHNTNGSCDVDWTGNSTNLALIVSYMQLVLTLLTYACIYKSMDEYLERQYSFSARQHLKVNVSNIRTEAMRGDDDETKEVVHTSLDEAFRRALMRASTRLRKRLFESNSQGSEIFSSTKRLRVSHVERYKEEHHHDHTTLHNQEMEKRTEESHQLDVMYSPKKDIFVIESDSNYTLVQLTDKKLTIQSMYDFQAPDYENVDANAHSEEGVECGDKPTRHVEGWKFLNSDFKLLRSGTVRMKLLRHREHFADIMGSVVFLFYILWLPLMVSCLYLLF